MDAPTTTKLRSASNATLLALSRRPVLFVLAFLLVAGYTANITQLGPTLRFRTSSDDESAPAPTQPTLSDDERRHKRMCYNERDYGMIKYLKQAPQAFCTNSTGVDPALGPLSTFTRYYTGGSDLRATVLTNTWIDLRNAQVFKPIQNISQDGHLHDPRFKYPSVNIYCTCNSNQDSLTVAQHSMPRAWDWMLAEHPDPKKYWKVCTAFDDANAMAQLASGAQDGSSVPLYKVHHVKTNAILLGRRDDHNPFFQISLALNAWTIMQVLDWKPETTQLVYLDDGLPSPIDDLQRQVLSPVHPVVNGRDILGSVLRFDQAMIAPFEYSGPMMRHLDDDEPCRQTRLIQDFRDLVMSKFSVVQQKRKPESCTITIITRRPYHGRMVQRKWLNEDAIVDRMKDDYVRTPGFYKYGTCKIQSVEFVDLSLADQMKVVVESDVIIGMHGAGMVNVLWARPETVVVEIFPKHRHRWGYRNLCQFVGCQWHQFRGGKEIGKGKGDNTSDKMISYADWFTFFDPIVRNAVSALEERVANNKR